MPSIIHVISDLKEKRLVIHDWDPPPPLPPCSGCNFVLHPVKWENSGKHNYQEYKTGGNSHVKGVDGGPDQSGMKSFKICLRGSHPLRELRLANIGNSD